MDATLEGILDQNAELRVRNAQLQAGLNTFARQVANLIGLDLGDEMPSQAIVDALAAKLDSLTAKDVTSNGVVKALKVEAPA